MIREIFVPLLGAPSDDAALDAGLALAAAQEAKVTAAIAIPHPLPMVAPYDTFVVQTDERQLESARDWAKGVAVRAQARLAKESVPSEVRISECFPLWSEEAAALQALHCDLTLLGKPGRDEADGTPTFARMFQSLLTRSGRPVLVLPSGSKLGPPVRRVTLAWKPTPEAARALHDAMPLLSRAAEIDVLVVDPLPGEASYGVQPGADVAHLLARHGFNARIVERPREGLATGECVLRHVRERDAELLVMGGYGHRRWREMLLGGTTREVLANVRSPVLFSH